MFPRLRTRISPALLGGVDRLVELSTLGSYGIDEDGRPMALEAEHGATPGRNRDDCPYRGGLKPSRCDAPARA